MRRKFGVGGLQANIPRAAGGEVAPVAALRQHVDRCNKN